MNQKATTANFILANGTLYQSGKQDPANRIPMLKYSYELQRLVETALQNTGTDASLDTLRMAIGALAGKLSQNNYNKDAQALMQLIDAHRETLQPK